MILYMNVQVIPMPIFTTNFASKWFTMYTYDIVHECPNNANPYFYHKLRIYMLNYVHFWYDIVHECPSDAIAYFCHKHRI